MINQPHINTSGDNLSHFIQASGLSKRFGDVIAVADLSFHVQRGELFGFLGPNGAGKTTTINMLTGLARPDAGKIRIAGIEFTNNPTAAQALMGIVSDESNLYPELSGFDNLCFCGALYGMSAGERKGRAAELLEQFGLAEAGHRKFGGYSRGMKRKLTIAAGIIHNPPVLFLDEPTTGIDVASARQIRQMIAAMHRAGTTIFLTTHYIEEAERLCERIAFIVKGRIIRSDSVANLLEPVQQDHVMLVSLSNTSREICRDLTLAFPGQLFETISGDQLRITAKQPIPVTPLVHFLEDQGIEVSEARRHRPTLEDVFVSITGIEAGLMGNEKNKKGNGA